MARLKNLTQMTGTMANICMYNMQGHDQIIIRTKGGPSKKQIKKEPQFAAVRRNNNEWSGCTKMTYQLRSSFYPMRCLEDYPLCGQLNALCKHIQKLDSSGEHGKRAILLSQHREMLTGLSFSNKQVLESVLRVPVTSSIDRKKGTATIDIGALQTDLYLLNYLQLPFFRIVACLGSVCDVSYSEEERAYTAPDDSFMDREKGVFESEWFPTNGTLPALHISLCYPMLLDPIPDHVTLILCLGIEFGKNSVANSIVAKKYSGTGKVMKCV